MNQSIIEIRKDLFIRLVLEFNEPFRRGDHVAAIRRSIEERVEGIIGITDVIESYIIPPNGCGFYVNNRDITLISKAE